MVSHNLLVFYFPALDDTPVPENKKLNFSKMCCCCIGGGVLSIVPCVLLAGLWSWVAGSWLVGCRCLLAMARKRKVPQTQGWTKFDPNGF